MAIIKNIAKHHLRKVVSVKIPVKEKWEQTKKRIAEKLNKHTRNWQTRHKKRFLAVFCIAFTGLLLLSIFKVRMVRPMDNLTTVPQLPKRILLPDIRIPKTFLHGDTLPMLPTGPDTLLLDSSQTVNYNF